MYRLVPKTKVKVTLGLPNIASSEYGNGTWTMVYDEGFHVMINNMEFFAFNSYKPKKGTELSNIKPENYISYCHKTFVGWYHDNRKFGCWRGKQIEKAFPKLVFSGLGAPPKDQVDYAVVSPVKRDEKELDKLFNPNYALIESINNDQNSLWTAKVHHQFLGKTNRQMLAMTGALKYAKNIRTERAVPSPSISTEEEAFYASLIQGTEEAVITAANAAEQVISTATAELAELDSQEFLQRGVPAVAVAPKIAQAATPAAATAANGVASEAICEYGLPCALDWRNRFGHNWMSNIRNQGSCGSCYAMALATVAESRIRIAHKDPKRYRISPQHAVSCSVYNQGCDGGFPFLVGKHMEHFGAVSEKCFPYAASDSLCSRSCAAAPEFPIANTHYIGGHYGNCSEEAMMRELMNGPISVAFEAPHGLFSYRGGIFSGPPPQKEDQQVPGVNPWQHTNHAVVGVGWGHAMVNGKRVKYWIMRNTWGKHWGENGHFRIVRGRDECGIESMSVTLTPTILKK